MADQQTSTSIGNSYTLNSTDEGQEGGMNPAPGAGDLKKESLAFVSQPYEKDENNSAQLNSNRDGSLAVPLDGGAQELISKTLEQLPESIKQEVTDTVMTKLTSSIVAAERAIVAVEKGESVSTASGKEVSGQLMSVLAETVWQDPTIPVERKLEIIFKMTAEMLLEAEAIDAKLARAKKEHTELADVSFTFPIQNARHELASAA